MFCVKIDAKQDNVLVAYSRYYYYIFVVIIILTAPYVVDMTTFYCGKVFKHRNNVRGEKNKCEQFKNANKTQAKQFYIVAILQFPVLRESLLSRSEKINM